VTSLVTPPQHKAARTRPPRARMAWVTWRQHRAALTGMAALLGAYALVFGITGLRMRSALAALAHSRCPVNGAVVGSRCGTLAGAYMHAGYPLTSGMATVTIALSVLPVLVGMFVGAPLLAREYEAGTFRFAWTQAVGRGYWLAAKLTLLVAVLAAAGAVFGALLNWWQVLVDSGNTFDSRWQPGQFGFTPVTFAAWTLFAFALGAFAGAVLRRTVPAMAAAAVSTAAATGLVFWKLTGWLTSVAPVAKATTISSAVYYAGANTSPMLPGGGEAVTPVNSWPLSTWFTGAHGQVIPAGSAVLNAMWNLKAQAQPAWLASHHLSLWVSYEPASRFWLFQSVEGAAGLVLALMLGAAAVWLVRRRAA
jgi:ABC-type transport system involved in multi-copper enzyme maturation permease subunit